METISISNLREAPYRGFGGDIPEDVVYQSFYNTMDAGIIGEKEYITSLIRDEDYINGLTAVIAMTDTNLIEYNFKVVNEIYLNCCISDTSEMTEAQILTLENIAYQLPLFGGNAVYQARAILNLELIDDYSNLRFRNIKNETLTAVKSNIFYPNPAKNEISINYNCGNECIVEIYDLTGSLVLIKMFDNKTLSVKTLVSGSYIFKLKSGNIIIADELITIIN
jgi:hypothetical protein